jgi:hypothetical protein
MITINTGSVNLFCRDLVEGLFNGQSLVSDAIATQWTLSPLPNRDYIGSTAKRPVTTAPIVSRAWVPPPSASNTTIDEDVYQSSSTMSLHVHRQFMTRKIDDAASNSNNGNSLQTSQRQSDGRTINTVTETGQYSAPQLQQLCLDAVPATRSILEKAIFGGTPPRAGIVASVTHLLLTLLLEPVRLTVDVRFVMEPSQSAVLRAEEALCGDSPAEQQAHFRQYVQAITVNLFSGVPNLALPYTIMSKQFLYAIAALSQHQDTMFDPTKCTIEPVRHILRGFQHNARITSFLERGRLMGAFARSLMMSYPLDVAECLRSVVMAAIDETQNHAVAIARNSKNVAGASEEFVYAHCEMARRFTVTAPLPAVQPVREEMCPPRMSAVLSVLQTRY